MTFASAPSRGLLRDYKPSDRIRMELFEALAVIPDNAAQVSPVGQGAIWDHFGHFDLLYGPLY